MTFSLVGQHGTHETHSIRKRMTVLLQIFNTWGSSGADDGLLSGRGLRGERADSCGISGELH